jgi:hypothetical protein
MRILGVVAVVAVFSMMFANILMGRYEIATSGQASSVAIIFRMDRLTGTVEVCVPMLVQSNNNSQPKWCPALWKAPAAAGLDTKQRTAEVGAPAIAIGLAKKQKLVELGASPEEIEQWEAWTRARLSEKGATPAEVEHYFGEPYPQ